MTKAKKPRPETSYSKILKEKAQVACEALQDLAFVMFEQGVRKCEEVVGRLHYKFEEFKKHQAESKKNQKKD